MTGGASGRRRRGLDAPFWIALPLAAAIYATTGLHAHRIRADGDAPEPGDVGRPARPDEASTAG